MKKQKAGGEKFRETRFCRTLKEYVGLDDWIGIGIFVLGVFYYFVKGCLANYQGLLIFYENIHAELIGIGITVLILGNANQCIQIKQEKRRLILQMGSPDNSYAIEAVRQLRVRRWLFDGTVVKSSLFKANLESADLSRANMKWVSLQGANLENAFMWKVHLEEAFLFKAQMERADLRLAHLEGANMFSASLEGTILWKANLEKAEITGANFKEADLRWTNLRYITYDDLTTWTGAKYNKDTQWPEGFDPDAAGCILVEKE